MTQNEFLEEIANLKGYRWSVNDGKIVGVALNGKDRGKTFNPVTALARSKRLTTQPATARGTERAAKALKLTPSVPSHLYDSNNRGYAQILRGKIKTATNVG